MVDVQPEVMDVFRMTGFSEIMDIKQILRTVSLEGCEVIGRGANGEVLRLDDETVVKLFGRDAPLSVVENERELARKSFIHGIPTAITYDVVRCDGRYGTVFELVDASSLSKALASQPARFDELASRYVDVYKTFHATHVTADEFPSTKAIYRDYIDGCADWYTSAELDALHAVVDSVPDRDTLIHGDYHPNNIMYANGELVMIDMGDVSFGHPVFDFLATAATQANLVELDPSFAEAHTGMPVAMIKRLWNYLVVHYFEGADASETERIERQIRLISKLKVALCPVVAPNIPTELIQGSVDDARQNFLPRVDELVGHIDW